MPKGPRLTPGEAPARCTRLLSEVRSSPVSVPAGGPRANRGGRLKRQLKSFAWSGFRAWRFVAWRHAKRAVRCGSELRPTARRRGAFANPPFFTQLAAPRVPDADRVKSPAVAVN